jgi:predicted nucleic acid-binding protein
MTAYVLDTSVAIAWYLPEVFSDAATTWQSKLISGEISLHVPTLHYWEIANVLRSHVRRGQINLALATDIWEVHLDAALLTTDPEVDEVFAAAFEYDATAYDAVYIALAIQLDLRLLTAERPSTEWVKKLGNRVLSIAV